MLTFKWDKAYLTGIEIIDRQHSELVDIINNLGDAIHNDSTDLDHFFHQIVQYAQFHFRDEEDCMYSSNVDERHCVLHKKTHIAFLQEATKIYDGIKSHLAGPELLFHFLSSWLSIHILGIDKFLGKQIELIQGGMHPKEAFEHQQQQIDETVGPLLYTVNQLFTRTVNMNRKFIELNASLENQVKQRTQELQAINNSLKAMALTDTLTKLANRRAAVTYLKNEFKNDFNSNRTISCIMIDVDKFKHINDTQGHESGDKVLVIVAQTIKDSVRNDDFVCRLGGDEFLVLSNNSNLKAMLALAEHIRMQINKIVIKFPTDTWLGSVSIGVASRNIAIASYIDLLKKADDGLYIAKRNGRNCVGCSQL